MVYKSFKNQNQSSEQRKKKGKKRLRACAACNVRKQASPSLLLGERESGTKRRRKELDQ